MTLKELYQSIDGDYEQAMRVLRVEKLLDKHIRRFAGNGAAERLIAAGEKKDSREIFESAHALKGVCGNLGLKSLFDLASDLAEEFRPGNERRMTDDEVAAKLALVGEKLRKTEEGIRRYEEG